MFTEGLAYIILLWYVIMVIVALLGFYSIATRFAEPPIFDPANPANAGTEPAAYHEPVTIIRPIKGIDPELESCLESSFLQTYPVNSLQIIFCVAEAEDPAIPVLRALVAKYPHIDAQILVSAAGNDHFGPNPKVNNLAKGFLRAKHDLLWIMDSNVWASQHLLANSVRAMAKNTNCGQALGNTTRRVKLVHHVPLAVALAHSTASPHSLDSYSSSSSEHLSKLGCNARNVASSNTYTRPENGPYSSNAGSVHPTIYSAASSRSGGSRLGSMLDEMFLFSSHSKFYVSLNNLAIAPCVNGKSNLYRKSDLDLAVSQIPRQHSPFFADPHVIQDALRVSQKGPGHAIEFFAKYIGEDNMIAIALWEYCGGRPALTGDVVVQPLQSALPAGTNSVSEYCNRRVRWLRVRKYMVLAATLVEPTTESIVCGVMGTWALSVLLWQRRFAPAFFCLHMACWILSDYVQYRLWARHLAAARPAPLWLQGIGSHAGSGDLESAFIRPFSQWLQIWLVREVLALPIWVSAMLGHEIEWRGKPFMIKKDLTVEEL